jgi:hypothetical protein
LQYLDSRNILAEEKDLIRDISSNSIACKDATTPDSSPARKGACYRNNKKYLFGKQTKFSMMMQLLAGIVVVTPEEKEVMKMRAKLLATFR